MKKSAFKLGSIAMAVLLSATALSACGGPKSDSGKTEATTTVAADAPAQSGTGVVERDDFHFTIPEGFEELENPPKPALVVLQLEGGDPSVNLNIMQTVFGDKSLEEILPEMMQSLAENDSEDLAELEPYPAAGQQAVGLEGKTQGLYMNQRYLKYNRDGYIITMVVREETQKEQGKALIEGVLDTIEFKDSGE